jgi:hypothetical protein
MIRSTWPTSADADSHIILYQNMKIYKIFKLLDLLPTLGDE